MMPILGMGTRRKSEKGTSLVDALLTRTQQRVLGILFGQPQRSFYANELIRAAGTGSGAVQRELTRLTESGLIQRTRIGQQTHFQANGQSPLFGELRSIVLKTVGLAEPLRDALKPLRARVRAAFVFGSVAKGTDQAGSDIDLMVIADDLTTGDLFRTLEPATKALGRPVNPTVYTLAEFHRGLRARNAFLTRTMDGPRVWVIGSEDDLASRA